MNKPLRRSIRGGQNALDQLSPGVLYGARVELAIDDRFQVSLLTGQTLLVKPARGVDKRLVLGALTNGTLVFVSSNGRSAEIQGALQTQLTPTINEENEFEVSVKRVRFTAEEEVLLSTRKASMALTDKGRAELTAERLTINAQARVRVLSAIVELP